MNVPRVNDGKNAMVGSWKGEEWEEKDENGENKQQTEQEIRGNSTHRVDIWSRSRTKKRAGRSPSYGFREDSVQELNTRKQYSHVALEISKTHMVQTSKELMSRISRDCTPWAETIAHGPCRSEIQTIPRKRLLWPRKEGKGAREANRREEKGYEAQEKEGRNMWCKKNNFGRVDIWNDFSRFVLMSSFSTCTGRP